MTNVTPVCTNSGQQREDRDGVFSRCQLHCVSHVTRDAQAFPLFYQLQCLRSCGIQNAWCTIAIFTLQIQYIAPSLNALTLCLCLRDELFLSPQGTFIFAGASAFIRIKHSRIFSFSFLSSLRLCLSSNNTFYRSKVFSISLPGFKEIEFKKLGAGENVDWILTWDSIQRIILSYTFQREWRPHADVGRFYK